MPDGPNEIDLDAMYHRRSYRSFSKRAVPLASLANVLFEATRNIRIAEASKADGDEFYLLNSFYSWLNLYLVVQGVEGLGAGVYQYDPQDHALTDLGLAAVSNEQIGSAIQGQSWIGGGGFCLLIGVQWERYAWIYRHSRAYLNLLIQVGEFAQEVLMSAYSNGLVGWMTPAVGEGDFARLLSLEKGCEDITYFIKLGEAPDDGR